MLDATDGFSKTIPDMAVEARIAEHCRVHGIDPLTAVKLFPVLARRQWLKRFLAHVELFKLTLEVPGDIAELGVYRGMGLFTWANLLESYCIGDRTKTVWGLDNWRGFNYPHPRDGTNHRQGDFDPSAFEQELFSAVQIFDGDRFIPNKPRIKLWKGDIEDIGHFVIDNPGVRFSLIHFDCDMFNPTMAGLNTLWPLLASGGVAIFDEYGMPDWPGETNAVDLFLSERDGLRLRTFPWTNAPGAYLIKP